MIHQIISIFKKVLDLFHNHFLFLEKFIKLYH